jgi:hypothetical protein
MREYMVRDDRWNNRGTSSVRTFALRPQSSGPLAPPRRQLYGGILIERGLIMNKIFCLTTIGLCLVACNKGSSVDLHNASANEVNHAVTQSGVMNSGGMIRPGLWMSKVTIQEMNIPGLPPQYAEKMKQRMAAQREQTGKHCITEADVKKPKEDFFGADKSCKYDQFTMGGGKIDIAMTCKEEGASQTTKLTGSYTPTTYSLDMASSGNGGEQSGMTMKMHVDAQRAGECTGKDD